MSKTYSAFENLEHNIVILIHRLFSVVTYSLFIKALRSVIIMKLLLSTLLFYAHMQMYFVPTLYKLRTKTEMQVVYTNKLHSLYKYTTK